jgi:steroid 5-alpha reductase family enzyme
MAFWNTYSTAGLVIWAMVTLVWIASVIKKDASIIDPCWSLLFVAAATVYAFAAGGLQTQRQWLLAILVLVWGLRLSLYLLWRNWGEPEDYRYAAWREEHGRDWWWRSFITVFTLQGLLAWIISIPLMSGLAAHLPGRLGVWDFIGLIVWLIGFFFEAVGDFQLARFRANPANKGQVLDRGVWRYSRHPNYFGETAMWWGFFLFAVANGGAWTIYAPILLTLLIIKVSGVSLLEKNLAERKPKYRDYIRKTPAFIPWFPKTG